MTIKDVESRTGLARSNIRFYEKEELIHPKRTENGYRDYSDEDVSMLKKIAWLRTLGISIEDIRKIITYKLSLQQAIQSRSISLQDEITNLRNVKHICEHILQDRDIDFDHLDVEAFTPNLKKYWNENREILHVDSVGFFFLWGSALVWGLITVICTCMAVIAFRFLPDKIPIQWAQGEGSQTASKWVIFIYPIVCVGIRFLLRPFVARRLWQMGCMNDSTTDYIVNYLCLLALIMEAFIILYLTGIVRHIEVWIILSALLFAVVWLFAWKSVKGQTGKRDGKVVNRK